LAPTDELIGIELLCDVISLEEERGVILLFEVGAYITWWISIMTKARPNRYDLGQKLIEQGETVNEKQRIYLSIPVMVKLPGSHILLSRWMPTWMRIGHYIEGIIAGFRKIDEVEQTLGKIRLLKSGVCPTNIEMFKLSLQKI
jgi:hypothetical protein